MSVGSGVGLRAVLGDPLRGTRGALGLLPLVGEQEVEVAVVPLGGLLGPGALKATGNGVFSVARTQRILPTQTLFGNRGGLWLRTHVLTGVSRTVCLTKGVTTGDKSNGFFVVHRHPSEGFANVAG